MIGTVAVRLMDTTVGPGVPDDPYTSLTKGLRVVAVVLIVAGILWLGVGVARIAAERGWRGGAQHPIGTVIRLERDTSGGNGLVPVVRFFNEAGVKLEERVTRGGSELHPGDIVDLVHVPFGATWVEPAMFRLGASQIVLLIGAAFTGGGIALLKEVPSLYR